MELKTYYDFALDDYRFLSELKKSGIAANSIGAIAQNFWNHFSEDKIPDSVLTQLRKINGFYFSTKYPGDDSQTLTKENISTCYEAVELCKHAVDEIIAKR